MFRSPFSEGRRSAGLVHQGDHDPEEDQEHQDACVIGIRDLGDESLVENVDQRAFKAEAGVEQTADQDPEKQGTVHLFGEQRQRDRYNRRNQRPESCMHTHNRKIPL